MHFQMAAMCTLKGTIKCNVTNHGIAHIAYSQYRAIPATDINIWDISVGTLTSDPAASRAARHACMQ